MRIYREHKLPPQEERQDNMRETVISCISEKLRRMDMAGLRKILKDAEKIIESNKTD